VARTWRGNVRELRSAIEQALLLAGGDEIQIDDLFPHQPAADRVELPTAVPTSFREAKERMVLQFEREFLLRALQRHGGNITKTAEEIGMYRQNLQQKMKELGINADGGEE
jgi:DNA-binding NtrC family response regulator